MRRGWTLLVAIVLINCFATSCADLSVDLLAEGFRMQIKARQFGEIYDKASKHLKMNATREEFIERAEKIVHQLEKSDPELLWKPEDTIGDANSIEAYSENTYVRAYRRIGADDSRIVVFVTWEKTPGDGVKLFGFSAFSLSKGVRQFHLDTVGRQVN